MAAIDSPNTYPESPMEQDDVVYPCKGCGEILEEGKAFELAGNRWHIDCFRCNTCGTLLDSDANLLLLGDGSLICNNCTYSCSACGNKIEDLAILTGDQAFCSGCFRCRNCKRKIENLRYARTSQGIFCMSCHESLMARRRKKARTPKATPGNEKALPSLPPGVSGDTNLTPDIETPPDYTDSRSTPQQSRSPRDRQLTSRAGASSSNNFKRDVSPLSDDVRRDGPTLPASTYNDGRPSNVSSSVDDDDGSERGFLPMAFDPTPIQPGQPPTIPRKQIQRSQDLSPPSQKENLPPRDYFGANGRLTAPKTTPTTRDQLSRDALSRDDRPGSNSSRDVSTEREAQPPSSQPKPSPHIYYQEKGRSRKRDTSGANTSANGSTTASPVVGNQSDRAAAKLKGPPLATDAQTLSQQDGFKLQEVPRSAKERSRTSPRQDNNSPMVVSPIEGQNRAGRLSQPTSPVSVDSQNSGVNPFDDPKRRKAVQNNETPVPPKHADRGLPLRADSLSAAAHKAKATPSDPSTPTAAPSAVSSTASASTLVQSQQSSTHERHTSTSSVPSTFTDAHSTVSREDGNRSRPDPPPGNKGVDAVPPPPRSANRPSAPSKSVANDDFIAPRHAPPPPPLGHRPTDSVSTLQSNEGRPSIDGRLSPGLRSAGLPKYSLDGGFSMDDEMGRIMRGEQTQNKEGGTSSPSVLRRVSNAVKHGRSFSDRAVAGGKSPMNGSMDVSPPGQTPNITSPTSADGLDSMRASLRRAQTHIAELEAEKLSLQEKLDVSPEIKAVNSELREKRTTMAFLDTQREMVVRELEIMTDHLHKAKDSSQPLDLAALKTGILKDFAESLQKLKENMSSQIEELMHKRQELTDEIGNLIQMKDKGFQEYENLSSKNAQLMQHNNELLRSIQGMYQDNRAANGASAGANGLGIYQTGSKVETPGVSSEVRNLSVVNTDPSMPHLLQDPDAEPATVLTAPQVVNIRKGGKPNKFNWRRGGEKITGKVTKGIKGAFVGIDRAPHNQGQQYAIGHPYNQTSQTTAGSEQSSINSRGMDDGKGAAYGFFGQKNGGMKTGGLGHQKNDSSTNLAAAVDASVLFGSDLTARCEYENRIIPSVVLRCIQEVEKRGLDQEGIYRKSGGAGQVKTVQQGFEADQDYEISDPDLEIHAVTSALKQYFRKLPTPLIVYDAYDTLLEAGQVQDKDKQVAALRLAIDELPITHRECLAYLVRHLAMVMSYESQNLMTPLNLAVVFAPTIMRPLTIEREMTDMQLQRHAVQALLENHQRVFDDD